MEKKKLIVIVSSAALAVLLVAGCFLFFKAADPYKAIPKTAVAIVEINDWTKFGTQLKGTATGRQLLATTAYAKLSDEVSVFTSLLSKADNLKPIVNGKIVASVHLTAADDFDYLFTIPAEGISDDMVLTGVRASTNVRTVNVRIFKGQKVVDVLLNNGRQLTYARLKSIFICSLTSFLTENSVAAILSGDNITDDKDLRWVRKQHATATDTGMDVLIDLNRIPVILPVAIKPERIPALADLSAGGWAAYAITFTDDAIKLNGVSAADKGAAQSNINMLDAPILAAIPDNTAYVNIGRNNVDEKKDKEETTKVHFKNWVNTYAFVTLEPLQDDYSEQNIFIAGMKDKTAANADLKQLMTEQGLPAAPVDSLAGAAIFELKDGSAINQAFGGQFTTFPKPFFTVVKDMILFCNNVNVLKFTLEKISKGETLNKSSKFDGGIQGVGAITNKLVYIDPQRADLMIKGFAKENATLGAYLSQFSSIVTGANVNGNRNDLSITLRTSGSDKATGSALLWKTKLKYISTYTPQIILNNATGEREIFTQDTANNIYLISKSGEVLFTKSIDESIVGGVQQLDYYNNGKQQLIFNTTGHIFIVDRNGEDVGSYPLRLSYPATAGLIVVPEHPHSYYYIPCSNGAIYGYESNGRPLSGFSPRGGVGILTRPIQRTDDMSILFADRRMQIMSGHNSKTGEGILGAAVPLAGHMLTFNNAGKLMLLNKKGVAKWTVENLPLAAQDFSMVKFGNDMMFLNAAGGQLIEIGADGNDNIKPLIDSAYAFVATNISDTEYLYMYANKDQVRSYNNKHEFKNSLSLKGSSISQLSVFNRTADQIIHIKDTTMFRSFFYTLDLKPIIEYDGKGCNTYTIGNLLGGDQLIAVQPGREPYISCYRIR